MINLILLSNICAKCPQTCCRQLYSNLFTVFFASVLHSNLWVQYHRKLCLAKTVLLKRGRTEERRIGIPPRLWTAAC